MEESNMPVNQWRLEKNTPQIVGEGVKFERIRRITGYLVGGMERFNDAKRAEVFDRVKHFILSDSNG